MLNQDASGLSRKDFLQVGFSGMLGLAGKTVTLAFCLLASALSAADAPASKIKPARDTTYFLGPLDASGEIDYEAALNERLRGKITPDENANVLLIRALGPTPVGEERMPAEFYRWLGIDEPAARGDYFIPIQRWHSPKLASAERNALYEKQSSTMDGSWKAGEFPEIADWLKANEMPLAVIVAASRRKEYYNPLIKPRGNSTLLEASLGNVQSLREATRALASRSMLRLGEGQFDAAWNDLLAALRLSRLISRGGCFLETLVGVAMERMVADAVVEYIVKANLTAEQCRQRIAELQQLALRERSAEKLDLTERVMCLDAIRFIRGGGTGILNDAGDKADRNPARQNEALARLDWGWIQAEVNRWYDRYVEAERIPDLQQRRKATRALDNEFSARRGKHAAQDTLLSILKRGLAVTTNQQVADQVLFTFLPGTGAVEEACGRADQCSRNLVVAFALAALHRDTGHYPQTLDELHPKYLKEIPGDLFSGKPLIYRQTSTGYSFYSVGQNEKDDGGKVNEEQAFADDLGICIPRRGLVRRP